jgi:TetR/AcrR family transcriptional regulator, cholesterol catabolism regulator
MPKGIPLTEDEHSSRRREIAITAANLFVEHGFPETSMREIALAAGMGKSSLYDYFTTKDDILLFLIEDMGITLTERARAIAGQSLPPDARLKQIMEMQLSYLQANNNLFWLLSSEAQRLKPESQRQLQERRYAFQDLVGAIIEEGIAKGCFRAVQPLNAARLLTNSLFAVLYTTRPTGSAEAMLDETVEIFLRGIKL